MKASDSAGERRTGEALRAAFDQSFAIATAESAALDDFLTMRLSGDPYAIRLAEVGGLYRDKKIANGSAVMAGYLGIAGFRGQLVPVYDLAMLLGYAAAGRPRWLVLTSGSVALGLAFEQLDAYVRLPPSAVSTADEASDRSFLRGAIRAAGTVRPIIQGSAILEVIAKRSETFGS
ncbi:MAG TPA: chemotaxis protein CheW [Polyangiaceae bacterium]|nr:chemotaxis protein CheW [Polyangiaceae bacterium]